MHTRLRAVAICLAASAIWTGGLIPRAQAQDLKSIEQRITTKVLPNGLTIVIF